MFLATNEAINQFRIRALAVADGQERIIFFISDLKDLSILFLTRFDPFSLKFSTELLPLAIITNRHKDLSKPFLTVSKIRIQLNLLADGGGKSFATYHMRFLEI